MGHEFTVFKQIHMIHIKSTNVTTDTNKQHVSRLSMEQLHMIHINQCPYTLPTVLNKPKSKFVKSSNNRGDKGEDYKR